MVQPILCTSGRMSSPFNLRCIDVLLHVSVALIKKAMEEEITLLKLPPHTTDKLQPLDVRGFGPLKKLWNEQLNEGIALLGPKETVSKSTYVDLLSKVWHNRLKK